MTDDERIPESQPTGASAPPPTAPSTALATPMARLPRPWDDEDVIAARDFLTRVARRTFDALDNVGDSIATAVGLR